MSKRNQRLVLAVVTCLAPFVFLSSPLKPWRGDSFFANMWQELLYPVELVWDTTTSTIGTTYRQYVNLIDAAAENQTLRQEIDKLRTRTIDYEEQALEVERLRRLLRFADRYERDLLVAEVLGSPRAAPFQSIRLSRGERNQVKVGMPVVTADGIVGRVVRTGASYSDVQLLTDTNFNLDVLLQRTRVRGVLRGATGSKCQLYLNRRAEIHIGDTIISSGIVGGFPKGLPVGKVVKISYESDNVSQTITVQPWVDYRRVEEVFVLEHSDRELQKIAETAGSGWFKRSLDREPQGGG